MLQSMRDKTQGLVAGIIATVIALSFALWGVQNYLYSDGRVQVIAKVNGKKITRQQENIAYEQLKHSEMFKLGDSFSLDKKTQLRLKKTAMRLLIKEEVLSQAMKKMGFDVGREQLWRIIIGLPIFQVNGRFSVERFRQITERVFYSQQTFIDGIRYTLLQTQLENGIVASAFALPSEIAGVKKLLQQRRDFGYFIVPAESFIKTTQIIAADIKEYYEQHQNEFIVPEKISIQYLELSADALRHEINFSEEQLQQYYQSHIGSFSTPKKWQVLKVLLPLPKTADRKALDSAREKLLQIKDEDDLTKVTGIQTTKVWLTRNEAEPGFATQLNKLDVGQISKPFRTKDGYSLGKILAVQPEVADPYAAVAAKVKKAYEHQQLTQLFSAANDKLINLTYINPDSLEPAAKELGLQIQTTGLVTNAGAKSGVLANNKVNNIAFSEAVLKHGYNSNPVEIDPGKLVVLRIKEHIPETIQSLDQVRAIIKEKLTIAAVQKKSHDLSQKLVAELRKGKSAPELAKQYHFIWKMITNVEREQYNENPKLIKAAFNLTQPNSSDVVSATVVDLSGDYAVLQLMKVYTSKSDTETPRESKFLKSLPERLGEFNYKLFVNGLMSKARIKINEAVAGN